ncbi:MAG TPA: MG2 domain-containing protein, partial [Bacteroidales bacterium]
MRKKILFMAFIAYSYFSSGQLSYKPDYNFGFERILNNNQLPDKWYKLGTANYTVKADLTEKHSGTASVLIQPSGSLEYGSFGSVAYSVPAIYQGKKIELRAYLKYQDVEDGQVGLMLRIDGEKVSLKFDNMTQRNIHGTSDWKQYSIKMMLPKDAATIKIGALLTGTGKLWVDDFQLLIDGIDIMNGNAKIKKVVIKDHAGEFEKINRNTDKSLIPSDAGNLFTLEKVYLHIDRETYYPGDDIWFKAYLVDASDRSLSNISKNLHVEIISPSSQIFDSRIVKIDEGLGKGDFVVPENLISGKYSIRAYTNYMRNFG